jgi:hypothetical protein
MPTLLEWTRAQHGLGLMWGATLYIFGIIGALMRWLKIST